METVISEEGVVTYHTIEEILRLVEKFEACALPRIEWTHHAHLIVALWYLMRFEEAEATRFVRDGIKRYNKACGIETTPTSGYHETITLFYIRVIKRFLTAANGDCTLLMLARSLINTYGYKNLPLEYYSRERLMSEAARATWLEPDLKAI